MLLIKVQQFVGGAGWKSPHLLQFAYVLYIFKCIGLYNGWYLLRSSWRRACRIRSTEREPSVRECLLESDCSR